MVRISQNLLRNTSYSKKEKSISILFFLGTFTKKRIFKSHRDGLFSSAWVIQFYF